MTKFPAVKKQLDIALHNLENSRGQLKRTNGEIERQREDVPPREASMSESSSLSAASSIRSDASSNTDSEEN